MDGQMDRQIDRCLVLLILKVLFKCQIVMKEEKYLLQLLYEYKTYKLNNLIINVNDKEAHEWSSSLPRK